MRRTEHEAKKCWNLLDFILFFIIYALSFLTERWGRYVFFFFLYYYSFYCLFYLYMPCLPEFGCICDITILYIFFFFFFFLFPALL